VWFCFVVVVFEEDGGIGGLKSVMARLQAMNVGRIEKRILGRVLGWGL
jgi:hypothetical protein